MGRRRRFSASNNYLGLEEAINSIEEDSDDGFEYDLDIIPPEPSVVADEEEGFDDENLPTNLSNDVPGNIEVFIRAEDALSDISDDERLAFRRARIRSSLPQADGDHPTNSTATISTNPVWSKCNPIYIKTYMESDTRLLNVSCMKKAVQDLTPVQIFRKIFDDDVFEMIAGFSNSYASQNNRHSFP
ncbi:hypothetical protein HHI36_006265 [Cryptolaemus montrouzieri]|uniref:PiggyBac transposable element-derived protein domain-containing protein n=1 Tax=Cryptolaemus montrouzieri TaxID=559131 RepID=A0ABD2NXP2_9CUCU